ncbi:MAG: ribonuclease R [Bacteroidales bacterium]|nr:ribonuclease R [Bacteroidales bacterium]
MTRRSRKKKTEDRTYEQRILEVYAKAPYQPFNYKQLSAKLNITEKEERARIREAVEQLLASSVLVAANRGKYKLNPIHLEADERKVIQGTISMKQTGKAYLLPENPDLEDIFIAANNTGKALNGDKVKVHLFPSRRGKRPEGRVVEVVKRGKQRYVGTIRISKNIAYFVFDDIGISFSALVPKESLCHAKDGQKVVVKLSEWPDNMRNPVVEVTRVLGFPGDNEVEMMSILLDQNFTNEFSAQVEKEAASLPVEIPEKEYQSRRDFRQTWTITIDPADAKDFDDAISYKALGDGNCQIGVHIADVSYYVRPNTAIDAEAADRATSVYLVDRTIPMLPEKLCNQVCSLRPHEDKLCFSVVFVMDAKGKILKQWLGRTVIHSDHRYNYDEVQQVIETQEGECKEQLLALDRMAKILRKARLEKGAIQFGSEEVKFVLDEQGHPIDVYIREQKDAHRLVEEFMLLANKKVAEFVGKVPQQTEAKAFVYRVHDQPLEEKIGHFNQFIGKFGYSLRMQSRKGLANSMNELFHEVEGKGEQHLIEQLALRTMQRAVYSTQNIGHYGLGFKYYTHFTSPIRRYPDLMVHRLLARYMDGKPSADKDLLEEKCRHASDMEQRATEAERNSIKYKQAEYLADKVGQVFDGLISGVSKWGIWVQLDGSKCEGMVSVKSLNDDFYYLDEENYRYIGQRHGRIYQLGRPAKVLLKDVDLARRQINFQFAEQAGATQ